MTAIGGPPSLQLIFDEVKDRLSLQIHQIEVLDAKAATVLSASSLVITVGTGLGVVSPSDNVDNWTFALFVAGAVFYGFAMLFGLRGYWVRDFRRDPDPKQFRDKYLGADEVFTMRQLLANMIQSFDVNTPLIKSKAWNIRIGILLLALETGSLVSGLILAIR